MLLQETINFLKVLNHEHLCDDCEDDKHALQNKIKRYLDRQQDQQELM